MNHQRRRLIRIALALAHLGAVAFIVFWFSRPSDTSFEADRTGLPHAESSRFADVNTVRIHYQEKGSGTPLVLIHGFTSFSYTWKDVFEPLSQHFRVIAVDLKGFGYSSKPPGDYTRRAQADLLMGLLDHLKVESAVLGGHSMGGEVSLNAAIYYPHRIRMLILLDSAGITTNGISAAPSFAFWPMIGPVLTAFALTSDSLVRDGLRLSFQDQSKVTDERVAAYYAPLKTRYAQRAAFLARRQAQQNRIEPRIGEIRQPALIIWGAQDQQIPLETGRQLHATIKTSQFVVFENCGHIPQEETPERVVNEIIRFAVKIGEL